MSSSSKRRRVDAETGTRAETSPRVAATTNATLEPKYAVDLGKCVDASAALFQFRDGTTGAIVSSHAKRCVALAAATGVVVWDARVGDAGRQSDVLDDASIEATALVVGAGDDEKRAYVGAYDGCLYALDAATGAVAWTFATDGPVKGCLLYTSPSPRD